MKIAAVFGTRPERIKLEPVVAALEERGVEVVWIFTNQSPDLVEAVDDDETAWEGLAEWSNLNHGLREALVLVQNVLEDESADALLVQGDTATAFAGAVAGFLAEVPVGHVEAGLRTYRREPWPEEAFRGAIARFARWHFCPDRDSYLNLVDEGVGRLDNAWTTGNPVIDTLPQKPFSVLVTLHRRENWGRPINRAIDNLYYFVTEHENVRVDCIRHPNWGSWGRPADPDWDAAAALDGLIFHEPVDHDEFLEMMQNSDLVVTDSGGLQEEAARFGVDCIVYRSETERTALRDAGAVSVVDPSEPEKLAQALREAHRKRFCYGYGDAGEQIAEILVRELEPESECEKFAEVEEGES